MMSERDFHSKLTKNLRAAGALVLTVHGHVYQQAGWPDLQVYHGLWNGMLELKVADNQLSAIQAKMLRELNARGVRAYELSLREENCESLDSRGLDCGYKSLVLRVKDSHGVVLWRSDLPVATHGAELPAVGKLGVTERFLRGPEGAMELLRVLAGLVV